MTPEQRVIARELRVLERIVAGGHVSLADAIRLDQLVRSGELSLYGLRDTITEEMARAAWSMHWMREQEERHERTGKPLPWGAGDEITNYVPRQVPRKAIVWAKDAIAEIEEMNHAPIEVLYHRAATAPGRHEREPTSERFGWDVGMRVLGTGASWEDSHPDVDIVYPWRDFYM